MPSAKNDDNVAWKNSVGVSARLSGIPIKGRNGMESRREKTRVSWVKYPKRWSSVFNGFTIDHLPRLVRSESTGMAPTSASLLSLKAILVPSPSLAGPALFIELGCGRMSRTCAAAGSSTPGSKTPKPRECT
jgi:hypothetical protein